MSRAQLGKALQKHGVPRSPSGQFLSFLAWSPKRAPLKFALLLCVSMTMYVYTMIWGFGDEHAVLEAKFSQYRFSPRLNSNKKVSQSYGFSGIPIQIAEIEFKNGNQLIKMDGMFATNEGGLNPEGQGPEAAIDGNAKTKWVDFNHAPIVVSFPTPLTLTAFRFVTAEDFAERDPARWRMEGSNNGKTWTLLHLQTNDFSDPLKRSTPTDWFDWFDYDEPAWGIHLRPWEDPNHKSAFRGDLPMTPQIGSFLQCRFIPIALRKSEASGVQISEIEFRNGPQILFFREKIRSDTFGGNSPPNEEPDKAIDGNRNTKWYDGSKGPLTLTWNEGALFNSFRFVTANDYSGRDPVRWKFKCTTDSRNWAVWHHQDTDYATPIVRRTATDWFNLNLSAVPQKEEEPRYDPRFSNTLPNFSLFADTPKNSETYEYCFHVTKLRNEEAGVVEISELEFRNMSGLVEWPMDTHAFTSNEGSSGGEGDPSNVIDGNSSTVLKAMFPMKLCISPGTELNITAFRFKTSDKFKGRDPVRWEFVRVVRQTSYEPSFYSGTNYSILHRQDVDFVPPEMRRAPTEWFNFDLTAPSVRGDDNQYASWHDVDQFRDFDD